MFFKNDELELGLFQNPKNHHIVKGPSYPVYATQVIFNDLKREKIDHSEAQKEQALAGEQ